MSDILTFWALQQQWGGPVDKLVAIRIADTTQFKFSDTDLADLARFCGTSEQRVQAALRRLTKKGLVVPDPKRRGPGYMLGALYRNEEIKLRMDGR